MLQYDGVPKKSNSPGVSGEDYPIVGAVIDNGRFSRQRGRLCSPAGQILPIAKGAVSSFGTQDPDLGRAQAQRARETAAPIT